MGAEPDMVHENSSYFIAGDWGTSNLRLYLCEFGHVSDLTVVARLSGPGIGELSTDAETTLFEHIKPWLDRHGKLPIVLSGMVGAACIGWRETPYQVCPLPIAQLVDQISVFSARGHCVAIVPGLTCENPLGIPDVMRGEELQLFGWLLSGKIADSKLVCLPGTHSKWVAVTGDQVTTFLTSLTGELYKLLSQHSVLLQTLQIDSFDDREFDQGVAVAMRCSAQQLIHTLFSTRSLQLRQGMAASAAGSYLSGLLIGADICGATALFSAGKRDDVAITLIGAAGLLSRYQRALNLLGYRADLVDGQDACLMGYQALAERLWQ